MWDSYLDILSHPILWHHNHKWAPYLLSPLGAWWDIKVRFGLALIPLDMTRLLLSPRKVSLMRCAVPLFTYKFRTLPWLIQYKILIRDILFRPILWRLNHRCAPLLRSAWQNIWVRPLLSLKKASVIFLSVTLGKTELCINTSILLLLQMHKINKRAGMNHSLTPWREESPH